MTLPVSSHTVAALSVLAGAPDGAGPAPRRVPYGVVAETGPEPTAGPAGVQAAEEAGTATTDTDELASVAVQALAIPEIAFLLTASGLLALAIWIALPHLWWFAAAAAPTLGAGLMGLWLIPLSPAGGLLLAFAATSLAMEVLSLPGYLLHASGGALALGLAGLCLLEPWSGAHPAVVMPTASAVGAATWWCARISWRATRADPFATSTRLVGRDLVVLHAGRADRDHTGHAVVAGHLWAIRDLTAPLRDGSHARVTGQCGDWLTVHQTNTAPPANEDHPT
jgi:membrane-bound ClpP family serine protease